MSDMPKMLESDEWVGASDLYPDDGRKAWSETAMQEYHAAWQAYVAQLREQVMGCVPEESGHMQPLIRQGFNRCRAETLANLQALFGERQDD